MDKLEEKIDEILMDHYSHLFVPGKSPQVGHYELELYADYRDEMSSEQATEILRDALPGEAFMEWLSEAYMEARFREKDELMEKVLESLDCDFDINSETEEEVRSYLYERVYINEPADHFLSQSFCANIFIDTGDGNFDFVLNHVYPAYDGEYGVPIPQKASINWLAKTQGYTTGQLRKVLQDKLNKDGDGFLPSMRVEVENISTHMNCLAFLVKVELRTLIKINELLKAVDSKSRAYLTVSKDALCGLYDPWNGGGSLLDIQLEKDVNIPLRYIRSFLPDGGDGYSIGSVYGLCDRAWKPNVLKDIKASRTLLAKVN